MRKPFDRVRVVWAVIIAALVVLPGCAHKDNFGAAGPVAHSDSGFNRRIDDLTDAQRRQTRLLRDLRATVERASSALEDAGASQNAALGAADRQFISNAVARIEKASQVRATQGTEPIELGRPGQIAADISQVRGQLETILQRLIELEVAAGKDRQASQSEVAEVSGRIGSVARTARELRERLDADATGRDGRAKEQRQAYERLLNATNRIETALAAVTKPRGARPLLPVIPDSSQPKVPNPNVSAPHAVGEARVTGSSEYSACRRQCVVGGTGAKAMLCSTKCLCETQCQAQSDRASCVAYCRGN